MSGIDNPQSANSLDHLDVPPEAAARLRAFWGEAISDLPPMAQDEIAATLSDPNFNITLPESILTFEGYTALNGRIQNLRTRVVAFKEVVDQHYFIRLRAIKSLEKVLMKFSSGRTEKLKEADVEEWLTPQKRSLEVINLIKIVIDSKVENLDAVAMQVSRQQRAAESGHKTDTIDFSMVRELPGGYGEGRCSKQTEVMEEDQEDG